MVVRYIDAVFLVVFTYKTFGGCAVVGPRTKEMSMIIADQSFNGVTDWA